MKDSRLGKFWEDQFDRLIYTLGQGGKVATSSDKVDVSVENVTADSAEFHGDIYCETSIDCNPDINVECNPEVSAEVSIDTDMIEDILDKKLGRIEGAIEGGLLSVQIGLNNHSGRFIEFLAPLRALDSIAEELASLRMIAEGLVSDSYHKEPEVTDQVTNGLDTTVEEATGIQEGEQV